jgi:hypothetical protein
VAWGEFDPGFENKPILLAVTQDGTSLAAEGARLVVPDDIRGGRYVSLVETLPLDRARQPPAQFLVVLLEPAEVLSGRGA